MGIQDHSTCAFVTFVGNHNKKDSGTRPKRRKWLLNTHRWVTNKNAEKGKTGEKRALHVCFFFSHSASLSPEVQPVSCFPRIMHILWGGQRAMLYKCAPTVLSDVLWACSLALSPSFSLHGSLWPLRPCLWWSDCSGYEVHCRLSPTVSSSLAD